MAACQSTPTSEHSRSDRNVRKRVCKACDRCRLKKSKCDGSSPCSRCRADNAMCVFGERKKTHDKVYPKGYVEMLEQQQSWLVHGLQVLYRRNVEGEGWLGEQLRLEPNGSPLTHDLLMRLGALDGSKGEYFKENPEVLEQDIWHTNTGMQRKESSGSGSDSPQSPVPRSRFSSDDFSQQDMLPTPPTYSPSTRTAIKTEPHPQPDISNTPQFTQPMSMQGVINPLASQGLQQWPGNGFNPFDETYLMSATDYSNMPFDDQHLSSPMLTHQVPMNYLSQGSYIDSEGDYEDFNQFINPNITEITWI